MRVPSASMPIGGRGDEYGRRLAGSLVLFCLVALGCCAAVTQHVAAHFDYAAALGPEWGHHVYPPLNWLAWNIKFHATDPPFWTAIDIAFAAVLAVAGLVSGIWVSTGTRRLVAGEGIHGTARFLSTLAEARAAGIAPSVKAVDRPGFSAHALYLATVTDGQGRTFYLRQDGNEHLAVIAPTRVGKGIGPVLMNALSWPDAWIAYDPKGELYQFSGGYHATLGPVWRWDPVGHGPGYARYNMLDSVRLHTIHEVGDTMDIATLLIDPSSKGDWDHWQSTAFALLTAVILYVLYESYAKGRRAALADVLGALSEQDTLYRRMVENQFGEPKIDGGFTAGRHEGIGRPADQQANRDPRERNGVHSTAVKSLVLFSDPLIAANTASSSFRIEDIWNGPLPGSLYITVGPSEELKLQLLLRMMLTLLLRAAQRPRLENENGQPKRPWRHRTLMMLDEFASLGRIKEIPLALSRIAGYGVQLALIIRRRVGIGSWVVAILMVGMTVAAHESGLRINTTRSLPRGLWIESNVSVQPAIGTVVLFCPPDTDVFRLARDRGYIGTGICPGGYESLQKPIAAEAGGRITLSPDGVTINGPAVPESAVLAVDSVGRKLPAQPANQVVPDGAVWLLSTYNSASFDSRYFGPIGLDRIQGTMRPLWTEE